MLSFGQLQTLTHAHYQKYSQDWSTRNSILHVTALVGQLAAVFLAKAPLDPIQQQQQQQPPTLSGNGTDKEPSLPTWKAPCGALFGELLFFLSLTACSVSLDLQTCVLLKLDLNARKYPVELCKGKAGKYTDYSDQTGITKTNQVLDASSSSTTTCTTTTKKEEKKNKTDMGIQELQHMVTAFANERHWNRFHTPRNVMLALVGELGELAELVQWKGDQTKYASTTKKSSNSDPAATVSFTKDELDKLGQELADVTIYLLRLSHVCKVPLEQYTLETCVKLIQDE